MSSLTYVIIGLAAGGLLAAIVFFLARRTSSISSGGSEVQTELVRRLELLDRGLRDEFSRNREEGASAAKSQREELGKSLESVRSIVDVRLKELQEDNSRQMALAIPVQACEHMFCGERADDPARRPRRLLRIGRAAR